MIAANKSRVFESLFYIYNRWLLRRSLRQILLRQDAYQPDKGTAGIYMINHSSWWDALILFYLNKTVMHVDAVAMMGEDGLRRFPFFRKLGAFSIDSSSRRDIKASLLYAKEQLAGGKSVFFFPQ
jgi:1-acyl-sn-glycerol-3-phosphate acyltransferase